jgi:cytidyltransferase-like protein
MTNGVFDVVHKGHAVYLAQARALGASLLVALNTDASAKRLGKKPGGAGKHGEGDKSFFGEHGESDG